jgi:alkylated DNA repair dioxygenase AlkB
MSTLFPIQLKFPEGFLYEENFLTSSEEKSLVNTIQALDLRPMMFQGFEAKRKVASFGYDYSFGRGRLTKGKEIPSQFHWLIEKTSERLLLPPDAFAELLATEYPIGSVINWHRDAPPFGVIAGISLSADCIFKLRPHDKSMQNRKTTLSFPVKRLSMYAMSGESRYEWQHSTAPVSSIRYSITLRTLR